MALMCTDDRIIVAEHDTGTVKLRARCFSHPSLTGEAIIGKSDTAKGTIINTFVFLFLTHTLGGWLNNELPCPVRITLDLTAMPSGIKFVQSLPKKRRGKNMHQVYRVIELGMDQWDIPILEKCIERRNTNPTF